jgi:hypothetical protein
MITPTSLLARDAIALQRQARKRGLPAEVVELATRLRIEATAAVITDEYFAVTNVELDRFRDRRRLVQRALDLATAPAAGNS